MFRPIARRMLSASAFAFPRYRYRLKFMFSLGIASGDKFYVRRSLASLVSEIIHEGTHALEFKAGVSQDIIRTREGELRAYKAEHQFQKAAGMPLDFANEDEILIHVFRTYDSLDKKRRRRK